jgi:hypothetical protein
MSDEKTLPPEFDWQSFTPEDSPKTPMDVMADPVHQDLSTPDLAVGDVAYNIRSPLYDFSDGTEKSTGEIFDLAIAAKEKPVALIFGSYT